LFERVKAKVFPVVLVAFALFILSVVRLTNKMKKDTVNVSGVQNTENV
jgi:hypothetical protein